MHVECIHAKRARVLGLVEDCGAGELLLQAAKQVERCLLDDIAAAKHARQLAPVSA